MIKPEFTWYIGSSESYSNLENIDPKGIYFLYDKKDIYVGEIHLSESIVLYEDGQRKSQGAMGKIYLNKSTLEGSVWNGDSWVTVLSPITDSINIDDNQKVSGIALKNYTDSIYRTIIANALSDIVYDSDNKSVRMIKNNNSVEVPITTMADSFSFDNDSLELKLLGADKSVLSSVKISDNYIIGGKYDDNRKAIILDMRDGSEVRLAAYALLNLFKGTQTKTMTSTVHNYVDGKNVLSCFVRVSKQPKNALTATEDGIMIDKELYDGGYEIETSLEDVNNVLIDTGDKVAIGSGYNIGGEYIDLSNNNIATEKAVKNIINTIVSNFDNILIKIDNLHDIIDLENPDGNIPITEKNITVFNIIRN